MVENKTYPKGMNPEDYPLWVYLKNARTIEQVAKRIRSSWAPINAPPSDRYGLAKHKLLIWKDRKWVMFTRACGTGHNNGTILVQRIDND